jgi:hypothetical protein
VVNILKRGLESFLRQLYGKVVRLASFGSVPKGTYVFPQSDFDYGAEMTMFDLWNLTFDCERKQDEGQLFEYEDCSFKFDSRSKVPKMYAVLTLRAQYKKSGVLFECGVDVVAHQGSDSCYRNSVYIRSYTSSDSCYRNSVYIRSYTIIPKVREIMVAIKTKAAAKNLNCAKSRTLSSYAWELLIIAALIELKIVGARIPYFGLAGDFLTQLWSTDDPCKVYSEAAEGVMFDRRRENIGTINEAAVIRKILSLVTSKKVHVGEFGLTAEHEFKPSIIVLVDPVCTAQGVYRNVAKSVDSGGYDKIVAGLEEMMYLFLLTFHIPHFRVLLHI